MQQLLVTVIKLFAIIVFESPIQILWLSCFCSELSTHVLCSFSQASGSITKAHITMHHSYWTYEALQTHTTAPGKYPLEQLDRYSCGPRNCRRCTWRYPLGNKDSSKPSKLVGLVKPSLCFATHFLPTPTTCTVPKTWHLFQDIRAS